MKIKQVEELVGITSKNIRFYEEQGLLHPVRMENGYRNYRLEDIEQLKKIKLLRKIGTSVEEIHKLFQGEISVKECLNNQENRLTAEKENIKRLCVLTRKMSEASFSFERLDTDLWLEEIDKMEKEGVDFVDVSKTDIHRKKKLGAAIGGSIMMILMLCIQSVLVYGYFTDPDFPIFALVMISLPIWAVIIGVVVVMKSRMKEIDKGEEDEAAKY